MRAGRIQFGDAEMTTLQLQIDICFHKNSLDFGIVLFLRKERIIRSDRVNRTCACNIFRGFSHLLRACGEGEGAGAGGWGLRLPTFFENYN